MGFAPDVSATLDKILSTDEKRKIAVFDADGTLWHDDVGEAFFRYQMQNSLAPGLHGLKDPWSMYKKLEYQDRAKAYGWLAQINAGLPESQLRNQALQFYRHQFKDKFHPDMMGLIIELKAKNFEIWICSASIRWAVEPAADYLGIDRARLIATETMVDDGRLTDKVVTPVPYVEGKKYWVERKLGGTKPLLVCGNSMGDVEMMTLASTPLAICFLPHLPDVEASEKALLAEARKRGWLTQVFQQ